MRRFKCVCMCVKLLLFFLRKCKFTTYVMHTLVTNQYFTDERQLTKKADSITLIVIKLL